MQHRGENQVIDACAAELQKASPNGRISGAVVDAGDITPVRSACWIVRWPGDHFVFRCYVQERTVSLAIGHFKQADPLSGRDIDMRHLVVGDQGLSQPLPCPCYDSAPLFDSHPFG